MTRATALAYAARRARSLNERLPEPHRLDLAADWKRLLERIENCSDAQAKRVIAEWTEIVESRISNLMLNAPLEAA